MLQTLAAYRGVRPDGLTRAELATLSAVTAGGTMTSYLSSLRSAGLIDEIDARIRGTEDGFALVPGSPVPLSPDEVVQLHATRLKAGARRMLSVAMRAPSQGFTRAELGRVANVTAGGTMTSYLSSLRSKGLIDERARRVYPSAVLYLGQSDA